MNATDQAKNGFKTFIITLAVSLFLFSIIYYIATDISQSVNIESGTEEVSNPTSFNVSKEVASAEIASVFGDLAEQDIDVPQKMVLAGSDTAETTQSTVPATGSLDITYALALSLSAIAFGLYFLVVEPRRKALSKFEQRVTKELN